MTNLCTKVTVRKRPIKNEEGWGRRSDEDDLEFAYRCALLAALGIPVKRKWRIKR